MVASALISGPTEGIATQGQNRGAVATGSTQATDAIAVYYSISQPKADGRAGSLWLVVTEH